MDMIRLLLSQRTAFICCSCGQRDHDLIGAMKDEEPDEALLRGFAAECGAGSGSAFAPIGS
jgi:hypothetical protein